MKKIILLCSILLCGCGNSSVKQLQNIKKPCFVYAKYKHDDYTRNVLIIKSADGYLITLRDDEELQALIAKYNVGDTIN